MINYIKKLLFKEENNKPFIRFTNLISWMKYYDEKNDYSYSTVFFNIKSMINDYKWKFIHRYIKKHQYFLVHTGLAPGYYDIDTRMLWANFNLLCSYVENELLITSCDIYEWEKKLNFGLSYGEWEMEYCLKNKQFQYTDNFLRANPFLGQVTTNKTNGRTCFFTEVFDLYKWWKQNRFLKPAPLDTFINNEYFNKTNLLEGDNEDRKDELIYKIHTMQSQYEENQIKEEEEMLIRLIKIRTKLWT